MITDNLYQELSVREKEILQALASGGTRQTIAEQLHISVNTYDTYRKSIRQKLQIKSLMDWSRTLISVEQQMNS
jgi:DNA-binding CsgD family transcriptional regulator